MIDRMEARVSTRGRVTIPIEIRRRLGIEPGTRLIVREAQGRIVVMTMASYVRSLRGKYKGKGLMQALRERETIRGSTVNIKRSAKHFVIGKTHENL